MNHEVSDAPVVPVDELVQKKSRASFLATKPSTHLAGEYAHGNVHTNTVDVCLHHALAVISRRIRIIAWRGEGVFRG